MGSSGGDLEVRAYETVIAEVAGEVEELVANEESTTSFSDRVLAGGCPARRKGRRGISRYRLHARVRKCRV